MEDYSELGNRIELYGERISKIEGYLEEKQKKSFVDRFGASAGLLALLISITSGLFSLYNTVVVEPQDSQRKFETDVRNTLADLSETAMQMEKARAENPNSAVNFVQAIFAKRASLAQKLENIYINRPDLFSYADNYLLARENWGLGDYKAAKQHADTMVTQSANDQQRAIALDLRANIAGDIASDSDLESVRRDFQDAIAISDNHPDMLPGSKLGYLFDWLRFELKRENCDKSQDLALKIQDLYNKYGYPKDIINSDVKSLSDFRAMTRSTCSVSLTAAEE